MINIMYSTGYQENESKMNTYNVYGKECKDLMELVTWKSANWALEEMGVHGQYQLTDEQPHKPTNLPQTESSRYDELYRRYFHHLCDVAKEKYESSTSER